MAFFVQGTTKLMPDDPIPPNPAEAFQKLLERKNNDANAVALQLFGENYDLRTKNRELSDKLPKDGTVTLTADEAKRWKAYEELGQEPKEIKKALEAFPALEKANKELAGMESLRELADIGLDGSKLKLSVLKDQMAKYPDAVISFKTEKDKDGTEAKVAYITTDGTESPFTTFATEKLADYMPALKVSAEAPPTKPGNTQDPPPQGGPASFFDRLKTNLTEQRKAEAAPKVSIEERFGRPAPV